MILPKICEYKAVHFKGRKIHLWALFLISTEIRGLKGQNYWEFTDVILTQSYKEITCSTEEKRQANLAGGRLLVVLIDFSYIRHSVSQSVHHTKYDF